LSFAGQRRGRGKGDDSKNATIVALEKNMIVESRLILNEKMCGGDSDD
jgi:hypothetical protein